VAAEEDALTLGSEVPERVENLLPSGGLHPRSISRAPVGLGGAGAR